MLNPPNERWRPQDFSYKVELAKNRTVENGTVDKGESS